jgi:CO/xanthine dehydrogenase Mo-binding subunit
MASAIVNAIYYAISIRIKSLPVTPEIIMGHWQKKGSERK